MRGYCSSCEYDPRDEASYNALPHVEKIINPDIDPETDELALSISHKLNSCLSPGSYGLGRSSITVKQIMRATEIVAMVSLIQSKSSNV